MKNIISEFQTAYTGRKKIDNFRSLSASLDYKTQPIFTQGIHEELEITLILKGRSSTPNREGAFDIRIRHLQRQMIEYLYGDIVRELHNLQNLIYDGEREKAELHVSKMISDLLEIER